MASACVRLIVMVAPVQSGSVQLTPAKARKLRILLVVDKPGAAARLKGQLEGQGHQVVGLASNGRQAIDRVGRLRPNLVIIDLRLAGIDGIHAGRMILAHEPLPVVLLVGHDAAEFVRRAREAGIMACSVTPADTGRLVATIDVALARFTEFQAIRRDTADLAEALVVRNEVEQAKRVLMRRLNISEAEAFRRLWRSRTTASSLGELAAAIVKCEKLFKEVNLVQRLQSVLPAIRRGLRPPLGRASSEVASPPASAAKPAVSDRRRELAERYAAALQQYLSDPAELALARAHELGRQARDDGFGVAEMATVHLGALAATLAGRMAVRARAILEGAEKFFARALAPFEDAASGVLGGQHHASSGKRGAQRVSQPDSLWVTPRSGGPASRPRRR